MKKKLLFAAMLALGAAPAVATAAPVYAAEGSGSDETTAIATEKEYCDLQDSIAAAIGKIDETYAAVKAKYPESEVLGSLEYTRKELQTMAENVKIAYSEGALTSDQVAKYQAVVKEYIEGLAGAEEQAEIAEYQATVTQHYMAANAAVGEAMDGLDASVANHYADAFYAFYADMNSILGKSYEATTAEEFKAICAEFDAVAAKAKTLAETAASAAKLVKDINVILAGLDGQIEKVKADFPEYDLSATTEAADYWKGIAAEFAAAPAEGKEPYTADEVADFATNFGWFSVGVEDLYGQAQLESYMAKFNEKYSPVSTKIYELEERLSEECPHVMETYYTQLDDLSYELTQLYMQIAYSESMTQEEFDKILATVEEIGAEADKIFAEAQTAEDKIVTGINGVSADSVSADADAYTINGVRVNAKTAKGLVIINGKKVVLK